MFHGVGCRVKELELRVEDVGIGVSGLGCRIYGLGFRALHLPLTQCCTPLAHSLGEDDAPRFRV